MKANMVSKPKIPPSPPLKKGGIPRLGWSPPWEEGVGEGWRSDFILLNKLIGYKMSSWWKGCTEGQLKIGNRVLRAQFPN